MINKDLESMIEESKSRGVWSGYVRAEYGEDAFNELIDSGEYIKKKTLDPINKNPKRKGRLWAIVKKGFDRTIF